MGNGNAVLVAGDGIPHNELPLTSVGDEHEAMAAADETAVVAAVKLQGEAHGGDTIGGIHGRCVGDAFRVVGEAADKGRAVSVVATEAEDEAGVGDEVEPALADVGCAGE